MTLRVLHVINGLGAGGSERSLAEMLPGLAGFGIRSTLACFHRRPEGVERDLIANGFDVRFIEAQGVIGRARALRRLVRDEEIELIHSTHFEADLAGRLAGFRGVPTVSSLVSTPYVPARFRDPRVNTGKLATVRAIDGLTGRHLTSHFHAVSNAVRAAAIKSTRFAPDRITVVERGRDPARLGAPSAERRAAARNALGLAAEDEVVVNVGRHEYAKGQVRLLDAAAALLPGHDRLVMLIVGREGAVSGELKRRHAELRLGDHVRFLGHRDDVPEVLAAADIFAFPSLYEGMPGAVIEAMALGLPVVGTRIDAIADVVEDGHNALLSEPGAVQEFASHLHELLAERDRVRAFGARSRERFSERFTLDRCTRRMSELFRQIVDRERPAAAREI